MSFFAVMSYDDDQAVDVVRCHLNFLALEAVWSDRFSFDVGLHIRAIGSKPVKQLRLALPFKSSKEGFKDLIHVTTDPRTSALIFGQPMMNLPDGRVELGFGPVEFLPVAVPKCNPEQEWASADFSVWTLDLGDGLKPTGEAYLRVRFGIDAPGRTWIWNRSLLAKNGATCDLRVSDTREAWSIDGVGTLRGRMCPIGTLNAFVIIPRWLEPVYVSPEPKYVRLLEGDAWHTYLGVPQGWLAPRKILIFQWKGENVSQASRFQGFLLLRRGNPLQAWWNHFRTGAIVLTSLLVGAIWLGSREDVDVIPKQVMAALAWVIGGLISLSVLQLVTTAEKVHKFAPVVRKFARKFENFLAGFKF